MKPLRYYEIRDDAVVLYPEPIPTRAGSCSMEFGKTLSEVRRIYSGFDLQPVWEKSE